MKVKVQNEFNNVKEIKLGFSWTYFFWGFLVPLFRGDWKWFLILFFGPSVLAAVSAGILIITFPVLYLVFGFFYNKIYAKELYEKGFRGMTKEENDLLISYISG